jgi:ubiquitin-protein ligase
MESCVQWRRVITELKILQTDSDVQSYFHYESSGKDEQLKQFCIYGYLLPRSEPYKNGSFKVRIPLPAEFPFRSPALELLTYIYHPAIDDDISRPAFCNKCPHVYWSVGSRISRWLEHYVNVIDQPDTTHGMYCVRNIAAEELYNQNKVEYVQKALAMIKQYSHPRPNRSIVS